MKYIDADRLKAEIEKRKQVHFDDYFIKKSGNPADYGASNALAQVISLIDSLKQEQENYENEKLSDFEAALFSAFSDAWQCYLNGEEVDVEQWAKEHSAELLEVAKLELQEK